MRQPTVMSYDSLAMLHFECGLGLCKIADAIGASPLALSEFMEVETRYRAEIRSGRRPRRRPDPLFVIVNRNTGARLSHRHAATRPGLLCWERARAAASRAAVLPVPKPCADTGVRRRLWRSILSGAVRYA